MMQSGAIAKASSFLSRKQTSIFPIHYELSPCRHSRFNMEDLWAGRILTPKRPIATMRYWLWLVTVSFIPTFGYVGRISMNHHNVEGTELTLAQ